MVLVHNLINADKKKKLWNNIIWNVPTASVNGFWALVIFLIVGIFNISMNISIDETALYGLDWGASAAHKQTPWF